MTDLTVEQTTVEQGIIKAKAKVFDSMRQLPNVAVDENGVFSSKHKIFATGLGAINKEDPGDRKIDDEIEVGRNVISGVSTLIKQELKTGTKSLGFELPPGYLLSTQFSYISPEKMVKLNPDLYKLIIGDWQRNNLPLTTKGIPVEVAEAIVLATASRLIRDTDTILGDEAGKIDSDFVEKNKPILQVDISRLSQELSVQEAKVDGAKKVDGENQRRLEQVRQTLSELTSYKSNLVAFISKPTIKSQELEQLTRDLSINIQVLEKTGGVIGFGKKVTVRDQVFSNFDAGINDSIQLSESAERSSKVFEIAQFGEFITQIAHNYLNDRHKLLTCQQMFDQTMTIIGQIAPDSRQVSVIQQQRIYLLELEQKDPALAMKVAKDFASRVLAVSLLKSVNNPQDWMRTNEVVSGFLRSVSYQTDQHLSKTDTYKKAQQDVEKHTKDKSQSERDYQSVKLTMDLTRRTYDDKNDQLTRLDTDAQRRKEELKNKMLSDLLVDNYGKKTDPVILWREKPGVFIRSKLLTDTVKAIFDGLPRFIPGDQESKDRVLRDYIYRVLNGYQPDYLNKYFQDYPDFLPEVVRALLPGNHPTLESATQLACKVLRRYPKHNDLIVLSGHGNEKFYPTDHGFYRNTRTVMTRVVQGESVILVPPDTEKLDIEYLYPRKWTGSEANTMIQLVRAGLQKFVYDTGLKNFILTSDQALLYPDEKYSRSMYLTEEQWQKYDAFADNLASLAFWNRHPDGIKPGNVYVIGK